MAPEIARPTLSEQPWFTEFLEARGFRKTAPATFGNGRATIVVTGNLLEAIPGDGSRPWRSKLREPSPDSIRAMLSVVLDAPSFQSQTEFDRRDALRTSAEQALHLITNTIRESPDSHSGLQLRQFVWSLFNSHHVVNLWNLKDVLDSRHNAAVTQILSAWMQGALSDNALRHALKVSGEMDRWDASSIRDSDCERLVNVNMAVNQILSSIPPGSLSTRLTQASAVLRIVLDDAQKAVP